jgi:hypothetical protein
MQTWVTFNDILIGEVDNLDVNLGKGRLHIHTLLLWPCNSYTSLLPCRSIGLKESIYLKF